MPLELKNKTPVQSNQDAFDRAWDRLVTHHNLGQCLSDSEYPTCAYRKWNARGEVSNACVVGWMIPDDVDWTKRVEADDGEVRQLLEAGVYCLMQESRLAAWLSGASADLLITLQVIHDSGYNGAGRVEKRLRELAEEWDLTVPE